MSQFMVCLLSWTPTDGGILFSWSHIQLMAHALLQFYQTLIVKNSKKCKGQNTDITTIYGSFLAQPGKGNFQQSKE